MIRTKLFTGIAATVVMASTVLAGTGFQGQSGGAKKYTLNTAVGKSVANFVSDAPAEKITGTADGVSGSFTLDASNLEATKGKIEVAVRSMTTAMSKRDEHMYSASWLGADEFPTITFSLEGLKDVKAAMADGRYQAKAMAVGQFTMHGVTKPITAEITLTYLPASAETAKRAPGNLVLVNARFIVALKDFNVVGKAGVVGKSVGETIALDVNLYANC
ncbi:MAG: YceI family protein [Bacteroidetes bacterium]|nr:YceI family protein [Bacteroidota bacterium]